MRVFVASRAERCRAQPNPAERCRAQPSVPEPRRAERGRTGSRPGFSAGAPRGGGPTPALSHAPRPRGAAGAGRSAGLRPAAAAARRPPPRPGPTPGQRHGAGGSGAGRPRRRLQGGRRAAVPRGQQVGRPAAPRVPPGRGRPSAGGRRPRAVPSPRVLTLPPQSPAGPTCCCCTARPSAPARGRPWARWRCSPLRDTAPSPSTCLVGARVPGRCRTSRPAHGRPKGLAGPSRCTSAPHPLFPPPPQAMGIRPPRGRWPRSGVGRPSCGTSCSGWACGGRSSSARP